MDNNYAIEGNYLLTDETAVEIYYTQKITNVNSFDRLFIEVLVLNLALKLVMPLAQDKELRRELQMELRELMTRVRQVERDEQNTRGRASKATLADSRNVGSFDPYNLSDNYGSL
jgi:hypothetical protein